MVSSGHCPAARLGHRRGVRRSARRREVLELIAAGAATKEIASRFHVTSWAIEKQLRLLYREYHVPNRAALVSAAFRRGELS
jgi:DNA-binding NarL/FixJ family response regulator